MVQIIKHHLWIVQDVIQKNRGPAENCRTSAMQRWAQQVLFSGEKQQDLGCVFDDDDDDDDDGDDDVVVVDEDDDDNEEHIVTWYVILWCPDLWWVFELGIYNTRLPKVEQSILKQVNLLSTFKIDVQKL